MKNKYFKKYLTKMKPMSINPIKWPLILLVLIFILYNIFVIDHCNTKHIVYLSVCSCIFLIYWLIEPLLYKDLHYGKEEWRDHFWFISAAIIVNIVLVIWTEGFFYHYHGVSIIRLAEIDRLFSKYPANTTTAKPGAKLHYKYKDSIRYDELFPYNNWSGINKPFVRVYVDCHNFRLTEYSNHHNFSKIHDFAFLDDTTFYTYHDFALIKPDLVYYQVGYNVLYKASCDTSAIADSTAFLSFDDVCGKNQIVKYSVKGYPNIPDTFLVYRNINEKLDSVWHVCAPEVNTTENRAKISDYGYIFHYDVYSKQEIESQCPRIKEYVEQYKKRITPTTN